MLKEGDLAPDFELESDTEGTVRLKDVLAKGARKVVLFFYPKDKTPGCTREAVAFSEALAKFEKAGAKVFGLSRDTLPSHESFRENYGLSIPLLSDPEAKVHRAYGAYGEKTMYGRTTLGALRTTYIVDEAGRIERAFRNVKVDGHVDAVLQAVTGEKPAAKAPSKQPAKKASSAKSPSASKVQAGKAKPKR